MKTPRLLDRFVKDRRKLVSQERSNDKREACAKPSWAEMS